MLERLLRSNAEVKVLGVVLFTDGLHLREIARRAGVSPYEAKKELENLAGLGVLLSERRGNNVIFRADAGCPFLPDLRGIYQKTEGTLRQLSETLHNVNGVKYAFVFGSAARGMQKPHSDIDLMIIGDADDDEISGLMFRLQAKSGREVNYILWTVEDLKEKTRKKSGFLKTIIESRREWLAGDEDEFAGTIEKRPHKRGAPRPREGK